MDVALDLPGGELLIDISSLLTLCQHVKPLYSQTLIVLVEFPEHVEPVTGHLDLGHDFEPP